jgi:hypothetical protein
MRVLTIISSIVLIMHGLIHLMGTTAYLKLAEIKELRERIRGQPLT